MNGTLDVKWLHGTPAKNLKAEIKAKVSTANYGFEDYKDYVFTDPSREFSSEEINIFEGKLDENGFAKIDSKLAIGKNAPGMLNVQFLVRAFENGGDFSIDAFTKKYAPFTSFIGLKSPEGNRYGSFFTDENQTFSVVSVDEKGSPVKRDEIEVEVYKIEWRWWWSSSDDNLSRYTSSTYNKPYKTLKISTNSKGNGSFNLNIPERDRGRFLIRVIDKKSGHATGRTAYFYKNWWENSGSDNKEAAKMLVFSADKEKYNVGETAKITFPSGSEGHALISIENGTKVLETKWMKTTKGNTSVEIPINKNMAPNVFVNISLLQPHQVSENDLPIRLFGVIPLLVEDESTKLEPQISMPEELQPEKEFTVKVSEKNNKAMTYTLAVVEEGLLDLTRFKTPNAFDVFYAREGLGVKTWDIFDDVIGAYSGSVDQVFAIGGDGSAAAAKNRKANRFKPVVTFIGPFYLKKGKTASHKITLPNYIGSVRTMVVAGDVTNEAFGNAEKAVPVKKPLMVLATLPRKLSPKEKVTLPITIFAMDKKVKNVKVEVKTSNGIAVIGNKTQKLNFEKPDEKMLYFEMDVLKANGINTVEIIASGNGEKATYKVELDVVNPNPITSKVVDATVEGNQSQTINFDTFGVEGSNTAMLELSTIPQINFSGRLEYLIQYPHGCVEQTTSGVFPQLFLNDIFDLTADKKRQIQENIENGIKRLGNFQQANGGLSYWMGESETDDWGTTYAGHFMLEAAKKGFVLPLTFKSDFIRYQKNAARNWRPDYRNNYTDLAQAYRLYTLALAGSPDLSAMNRMREFKQISNDAKWRLAAAYALAGQKEASLEIMNTANINFTTSKYNYYSYGSVDRNRAMALETMLITDHKDIKEVAKSIAKELSGSKWMSTQSTAYSLLAIGKMVVKNGGKSINLEYTNNGKTVAVDTQSSMVQRTVQVKNGANSITIKNEDNNVVFARIINSGQLPLGDEITESRGLSASVQYVDLQGKSININSLKQGQDFVAKIIVSNPKNENVKDIALTQVFPSGWEIVNTRFTDFGTTTKSEARYTDIRDDGVNFYFDLNQQSNKAETKTFTVLLNAAYLGNYYLPGIQVEAMYDHDYLVRTKGRWIEVIK
ncbi:alpha-2-macroglobulin [Polaribacter sejongensis]|uniref:alpha-2-macroglobulin family protein n=1 Tax=Polaribacter sejongensis TaxID=985043 RepID=UPI0035A61694